MIRKRPLVNIVPQDPLEEFIISRVGPEGLLVFRTLQEFDKEITEDVIAEKLGFSKNMTRRLLYRLQNLNFVVYKRVKKKDTGWYYYYWKVNTDGLNLVMLEIKKTIIDKLKEKYSSLESEQGVYQCPSCGQEFGFDEAFNFEFTCPKCGVELVFKDKSIHKDILKEYIARLEEELGDEKRKLQSNRPV